MSSTTITRTFSLIPISANKKEIYKTLQNSLVKFRDLENIFIKRLIDTFHKGDLTIQDFSGTSTSHIKSKIYNHLELNTVKADQWKTLQLKERINRCAIQYPYHAVRNWLIRTENLSHILVELIELFHSDRNLIAQFFKGKRIPKSVIGRLFEALARDSFGASQSLTYFHITNMIGQLRNIVLSETQLEPLLKDRLHEIREDPPLIERFLKTCLHSFTKKKNRKHIALMPHELPQYFLDLYFRKIKWLSTRSAKKRMPVEEFHSFTQTRDKELDAKKREIIARLSHFSLDDLHTLSSRAFHAMIIELVSEPNIFLPNHLFKPYFRRINVDIVNPTYEDFLKFFQVRLRYKIKERVKELFLTDSITAFFLSELEKMRAEIYRAISIPHIEKFALPIQNLKETQVYKSDLEHLTIELSFVRREFHKFQIKDTKGRIKELLRNGGEEHPPVIRLKRGKLYFHLPFEVQKKSLSKQSHNGTQPRIEIGVDLGLKHFAVLSVMDKSSPQDVKEIARYFLGQKTLFDMIFNISTGRFEKKKRFYNTSSENPSNVKTKLIHIRSEIGIIQHKLHEYQNRLLEKAFIQIQKKRKNNRLEATLGVLWDRIHHINLEIVRLLNHTILQIARYHKASVIKCENLKWARHSKRKEVGTFLAFWQTHWFYAQIQDAVKLQAYLHNIHFKRIKAGGTSQICSHCGNVGQREGKRFYCSHCKGHLDSDLNAARNIALAET
jgi:transposase